MTCEFEARILARNDYLSGKVNITNYPTMKKYEDEWWEERYLPHVQETGMMTRQSDIYAAIESERAYQDARMADPSKPNIHPLNAGEIILAMEQCLVTARAVWWADNAPYPHTAEYIRKIAGLAVQFMEAHGAPQRKGYER